MIANEIAIRVSFISQMGVGTLGNFFLLGLYAITFLTGDKLRSVDLILTHLAFVNILVLLSKGIPHTMITFRIINNIGDFTCKFILYFHRVARGLSLSTTCFLSGVQAITISPGSSRWAELKARIPECILPFSLLFWILQLLTNSILFVHVKVPQENRNFTKLRDFVFCSASFQNSIHISMFVFIISLPDIVFIGTMIYTSQYMILVLYHHQKQIHYIHSNKLTPKGAPATKATQNILLLVSIFVCFYLLNAIFSWYISYVRSYSWLVNSSAFLSACFPAISPFILLISDSQIPKYGLALWYRRPPRS